MNIFILILRRHLVKYASIYIYAILTSFLLLIDTGKSDCPYYARSELLGDKLARNLPDFQLHKVVVKPEEWDVSFTHNVMRHILFRVHKLSYGIFNSSLKRELQCPAWVNF